MPESYVETTDGIRGFNNIPKPPGVKWGALGEQTDHLYATDAIFYLRWDISKQPKPWLYSVSLHNPHDICYWVTQYQDKKYLNVDTFPPLPDNFDINPDEAELISAKRSQQYYGAEISKTEGWTKEHWRCYLHAYYHMAEQADRAVGSVLDALEAGGWADNTMIVFTSDHGEGIAARQWLTKLSLYEEAAKVPMIISYPGKIPEGVVDDTHLVSGVDVLPTMADYAGVPTPKMTGQSLRTVIENPKEPGRAFVVTELGTDPKNKDRIGRMVCSAQYKYCAYSWGKNAEQLFDLRKDPGETRNLAGVQKMNAILQSHRDMLKQYCTETKDSFQRA